MNFQQIRDSLGQMDGQYQAKTEITATIKQVKPVEYSQTSGKPGQSLYIELDSGEQDWVKFSGKGVAEAPLDHNAIDQRAVLLIWPFRPEKATKIYLYCWIQRQAPQQGKVTPYQPPQGVKPPSGIDIESQILAMAERLLKAIESLAYPNATTERPTQPSGPNSEHGKKLTQEEEEDDIPF